MARKKQGAITLVEIGERRAKEAQVKNSHNGKFIKVPNYHPKTMIEVKEGVTEKEAINRFLNKPNQKTR